MTKEEYIKQFIVECKKIDDSKDYIREANHYADVLWEPDKDMSPREDAEFLLMAAVAISLERVDYG